MQIESTIPHDKRSLACVGEHGKFVYLLFTIPHGKLSLANEGIGPADKTSRHLQFVIENLICSQLYVMLLL